MNIDDKVLPALRLLVTQNKLGEVNAGGQIAAKETQYEATPSVFVSLLREIAGETIDVQTLRQTVEEQLQVIMVAKYADFDEARGEVLKALFGMNPYATADECLGELEFVEGVQIDGTASYIYWRDIFSAKRERRLM